MAELKPCPFCGSTDLKHYVTSASGGRYRGVIVCKKCGVRKEAYSDWTHSVSDAYCGDWKEADEFTREQARGLAERDWNRRYGECDHKELLEIADNMERNANSTPQEDGLSSLWLLDEYADQIREAIGEED